MRRKLLISGIFVGFGFSLFAQSIVSEKQIPLTKDMKKHEMEFALGNPNTGGLTVYYEMQKGEKVKGQPRKYERLELTLDKDLNITESVYKTVGTKRSIKPKLYFKDYRLAYFTWIDDDRDDKVNKMMFELVKFDNNNNIVDIKDYELCDERGFDNYRVLIYGQKIIVMAQYEKKKTKDKNEKNRDYVVYKIINPATMETEVDKELNLLGKDDLGLEAFLIKNDKIFMVGKQIQEFKVGIKIIKGYIVFRLSIDGTEEARGDVIPPKNMGIGSVYIAENNNILYLAGEYGNP